MKLQKILLIFKIFIFLIIIDNFYNYICIFSGKRIRDVEAEERMEELYDRMRDIEKQNMNLKEKVRFYKN